MQWEMNMVREMVRDDAGRVVAYRGDALKEEDMRIEMRGVYARASGRGQADRREQRRQKDLRQQEEACGSVFMPGEI